MKYFWLSTLLFTGLACASAGLAPESRPNPWADDYRNFSSLEHKDKWGTYNVHDPSCKKFGDTYYMYSTDAIYAGPSQGADARTGYIQVRRSKDLVDWEFVGWALPEIPAEAKEWVLTQSGGRGAGNIWAPYITEYKGVYRLYYCVSAFARQTSYIGLLQSESPLGPWRESGCVVKTAKGDLMNAIDPSVVTDPATGRQWMHYGSYFGGLYCMELDPGTGLALKEGDQGALMASRFNIAKDNIEAPEVVYHPGLKKYFLFVSYDPLMTTYNVRVGRSDNPEGPFYDFFGEDMRLPTDNFPILTHPYRFDSHPGWAGTGHCGVTQDGDGNWFMLHQGRLSPDNHLMVLHVREMRWTQDGWPVVSPERYAATGNKAAQRRDIPGVWEVVRITPSEHQRGLEAGQVLWGENLLNEGECCVSVRYRLDSKGKVSDAQGLPCGEWELADGRLRLSVSGRKGTLAEVFPGHDWERQASTLLFTGLDETGRSIWGKKVE